jgi:hypothetical protein
MMQIGAFVFSLIKKNQQKEAQVATDEYFVFSKNNAELNLKKKTTYFKNLDAFLNNKSSNIEIIFDVNSFSFKQIMTFMERNKAANITFKNKWFASNFLIGSNSSNDRGEVILIDNLNK